VDIKLLKKYLKVDDDITEMDDVITGYQAAAETYIENAGCKVDYSNKLCEMIIVIYVTRMLESPDLLAKGTETAGMTLNGMIAQLRMSQK
jgi:hypothetical protein